MNQCNGNGLCSIETGACSCYAPTDEYDTVTWKGGDCGVPARIFGRDGYSIEGDKSTDTKGPKWLMFTYNNTLSNLPYNEFGISTSAAPLDVYLTFGAESEPTKYNYDMKFTNVTKMKPLYLRDRKSVV